MISADSRFLCTGTRNRTVHVDGSRRRDSVLEKNEPLREEAGRMEHGEGLAVQIPILYKGPKLLHQVI